MSYQQLIAGKVKLNGLEGLRRHLQEREHVKTNPNIDLSRSHLNYCIEEFLSTTGLSAANITLRNICHYSNSKLSKSKSKLNFSPMIYTSLTLVTKKSRKQTKLLISLLKALFSLRRTEITLNFPSSITST